MANLKFIPTSDLNKEGIQSVSKQLYERVSDPDVRQILENLNLPGVIARYGLSAEHARRQLTRGVNEASLQGLGSFVISSGQGEITAVGMASTQEGLPLYRQRLRLPAGYTRAPVVGPFLRHRVKTPPVNVSAWADFTREPGTDNSMTMLDDLTQAYTFLRKNAPQSWTLSPLGADAVAREAGVPHVHQSALIEAGYTNQREGWEYYDDMEVGRKEEVPLSVLYVSRSPAVSLAA